MSLDPTNQFFGLKLSLFLIRTSGQNVLSDSKIYEIITFLTSILVGIMLVLGTLEPILNFTSLEKLPDSMAVISNFFVFLWNTGVYKKKQHKLRNIIYNLSDFWGIDKFGNEVKDKQLHVYRFLNKCFLFYITPGLLHLTLTFLKVIFLGTRNLPNPCYDLWNFSENPMFWIIYSLQAIDAIVVISFIMGMNCLFYALIAFCYCQMMMLKKALRNIDFKDATDDDGKIFKLIKTCVDYHSKLLEFLIQIDDVFSFIMFGQVVCCVMNFCMPIYLLATTGISNLSVFISCILVLAVNMAQLFLSYMAASLVTYQSGSIGAALYETNWSHYKISSRIKSSFVMLLQRTQKPFEFTAAGAFKMNMQNYISIIQMSFSFFTLMKTFNDKQK